MTNLISGKEALIALANGEDVEVRWRTIDKVWINAKSLLLVESFLDPATSSDFRLKPRTITINGIKVPAPFEPKVGEKYWFISTSTIIGYGFNWFESDESDVQYMNYGVWRTEEEIKQVTTVLRQVFGKESEDE